MAVVPGLMAMLGVGKYLDNQQKDSRLAEVDRLKKSRSSAIKGLVGEENKPYLLDSAQQFEPGEQIPGLEIAGSGLMGGAGQFDAGNQATYAGGLMQIPGMEKIGAQLLTQAQDRQQRGQFAAESLAMKQGQFLAKQLADRQAADAQEINALKNFGFKDQSSINSALNSWQKQHDKQILPIRYSLDKYQNVVTRYNVAGQDLGQFNGADDLMMTRAFIKMMNGGREAFMSDDAQAALMATQGFGTYDQILNMITGKGTMDKPGRQKMFDVMNTMAIQLTGSLQGERALMERKLDYFGVPRELIMRDNVEPIVRDDFGSQKGNRLDNVQRQTQKRSSRSRQRSGALPSAPAGVTWAN